jgi:hypothetical protein
VLRRTNTFFYNIGLSYYIKFHLSLLDCEVFTETIGSVIRPKKLKIYINLQEYIVVLNPTPPAREYKF